MAAADGVTFESQGPAVIAMFLQATGGNYPVAAALWEYEHNRELAGLPSLPAAGSGQIPLPAVVQQAVLGGHQQEPAAQTGGAPANEGAQQIATVWGFAQKNPLLIVAAIGFVWWVYERSR